MRENNVRIIDILGNVVESRNLESGEHIKRVKGFARILGYQLMKDYPEYGLTEERVEMIAEASALHDVGKIAIPDNILLKPGRLTEEEFELMKSHTTRGCDILNNIEGIWEDDYRRTSYEICRIIMSATTEEDIRTTWSATIFPWLPRLCQLATAMMLLSVSGFIKVPTQKRRHFI